MDRQDQRVSYDAKWGLRFTPAFRLQQGQPYARTFQATMNYGAQRFLAEPFGSRQQDNIYLVDTRVEKAFKIGKGRTVAGFIDGYNLTNTNAAPEHQLGFRHYVPPADDDRARRGCGGSARSLTGNS